MCEVWLRDVEREPVEESMPEPFAQPSSCTVGITSVAEFILSYTMWLYGSGSPRGCRDVSIGPCACYVIITIVIVGSTRQARAEVVLLGGWNARKERVGVSRLGDGLGVGRCAFPGPRLNPGLLSSTPQHGEEEQTAC